MHSNGPWLAVRLKSVLMQVWLSYASFEATPASMLGEEQDGETSEAERRQAAAEQEGPAAAADREAHARRSVHQSAPFPLPPVRLLLVVTPLCICFLSLSASRMHVCQDL